MKNKFFLIILLCTLTFSSCNKYEPEYSEPVSDLSDTTDVISESDISVSYTTTESDNSAILISDDVYKREDGLYYIGDSSQTPEESIQKFPENIQNNLIVLNVSIPFSEDYKTNSANLARVLNVKYNTDTFYSDGPRTGCRTLEQTEESELVKKMMCSKTPEDYIKLQSMLYEEVKKLIDSNYNWPGYPIERIAEIGANMQGIRGTASCPTGEWGDITYSGDPDLESFEMFYNSLISTQFTVYDWVAG